MMNRIVVNPTAGSDCHSSYAAFGTEHVVAETGKLTLWRATLRTLLVTAVSLVAASLMANVITG